MNRNLRRIRLGALFFFAAISAGEPVQLGSATGVSFSGYSKDSEGRRQWEVSADKAYPFPGSNSGNDWLMERIRIRNFGKKNATLLTISAPRARYRGDARSAEDSGPVTAEGELIRISGRNWSWKNQDDKSNFVTLREAARVVISPGDSDRNKISRVSITSDSVTAKVGQAGGAELAFSGKVMLNIDDTLVTCDRLSAVVRPSHSPGRQDIERIDADGSVRLVHSGVSITGKTASIFPDKNLCSVIGEAEFCDLLANRVKVRGDAIYYDRSTDIVKVTPRAEDAGLVSAELPCLSEFRADDLRQSGLRAKVFGENLEIRQSSSSFTLKLSGKVRLEDPDYVGFCEKLSVDVDTAAKGRLELFKHKSKKNPVRRLLAEESVSLSFDGKKIRCGRAELYPEERLAIATLSPRAEYLAHGVTFEAQTIRADSRDAENSKIIARGFPGSPVRVTMPGIKKTLPDSRLGVEPITVESDVAILSRKGLVNSAEEAGVLEFEGKVTIQGDGLSGSCLRLGVEVTKSRLNPKSKPSVRRIVAVGEVNLRQDFYAAQAGRAELLLSPKIKEIAPSGGKTPLADNSVFVSLEPDSETSPGLRTKITLPTRFTGRELKPHKIAEDKLSVASVEADYQEVIQDSGKLRAFARGDVAIQGDKFSAKAASVELLSLAGPGTSGSPEVDTVVGRGGVRLRFDEHTAGADIVEIFPVKNRIVLSGSPFLADSKPNPNVGRKIIEWTRDESKSAETKVRFVDEPTKGLPEQIIRPRILIPMESSQNLGRSLKWLDKGE